MRNSSPTARYYFHTLIIFLYGLFALVLTWPLATALLTHVPGTPAWAFDEFTFVWNMWWFKFSLLDLGQTPLHTHYIFYPLGIDLVAYTYNLFDAMIGLPLQLACSLPFASNIALLIAYILSGYGTYLLVQYMLRAGRRCRPATGDTPRAGPPLEYHLAAFIAGCAYAFAASRMIYAALGHYMLVTVQWFPFALLFFLKTLRERSHRNPVLAGLFLTLLLLVESTFGVFWLFFVLVLLAFEFIDARKHAASQPGDATASAPRERPSGLRVVWAPLSRLAVLGGTAAVLWSPMLAALVQAYREGELELSGWGNALHLSADLVGLFTPTALHPLFGAEDWPAHLRAVVEGKAGFLDVNTVFLGFGLLALALVGTLSLWKQARAWAAGAVLFTVLALGPLLQIRGQFIFPLDGLLRGHSGAEGVTLPLPFALLHFIPFIKANRAPNRFSVTATLALAVLAGHGAFFLLTRLSRSKPAIKMLAGAALLAILLFDQLSIPMPLSDARIPSAYDVIASDPEDYAILELPLGWRHSFGTRGAERTQLEYYQSYHHKRLLAGNTSRAQDFKFDYFTRIPLIRALTAVELYNDVDDETLAQAHAQAGDLVLLYDLRYLVVHDPIPMRYPEIDTLPAARDLALSLLPVESEPVAAGNGATVYRIVQPPLADPLRVDYGEWTSSPYRGEGWNEDEEVFGTSANWILGTEAEFYLPVRGPGDRHLTLRIAPFSYPGAQPQTLSIAVNDRRLDDFAVTLNDGWQAVDIVLSESVLRPGLNTFVLFLGHAVSPADILPDSTDERPLAAAVDWMEISTVPRRGEA